MTTQRLERDLPAILDELVAAPYPDYIDDVLATTAQRHQRPTWTFPERWLPVDITTNAVPSARVPWRPLAVLAIIAILLAATLAVYVGTQQERLPAPFGGAANGAIVFAQGGDIRVGDQATGETRLLVGGPETDLFPEVSRDGTKILFGRQVGEDIDLYVVRTDGTGLRKVTDVPLVGAQTGAWSADGREYYQTHVVEGVGVLEAFDVVGDAQPRRLAENVADTIGLRPPDGREIAFRSLVDGAFGIAIANVDGTGVRDLIPPTVPAELDQVFLNFSYTPDGSRLFYQHGSPDGNQYTPDDACCRLWVMNADGTDQREFRDLGWAWDGLPVVSPDGTWVAFWHNLNTGATHRITVARTDGTGPVIETGPRLEQTAKYLWSPDSTKILAYPNGETSAQAYVLDPAGGDWTTLSWQSDPGFDWQRKALP